MTVVPQRVVLSGYYGYANLGDDAILLALCSALRAAGVAEILVPAGPRPPAVGPPVRWLPRYDWRAVRAALADGGVLLSGGGGLFQDSTSLRSLGYYLGHLWLAQRARRPVAVVAQSIGPLRRPLARWLVARALRRVQVLTVRDQGSLATIADLDVRTPPARVLPDPAFGLPAPSPAAIAAARAQLGPGPRVLWWLRPTAHTATVLEAVRGALPQLTGAQHQAVACQACDQAVHEALSAVWSAAPLPPPSVSEALALIAVADLVVAERLHPLIFAARVGTPAVAIQYDPKVAGLAADAGLPVAGHDASLTAAALQQAVAAAWSAREPAAARLRDWGQTAHEALARDLRELLASLA
ncbi:MAG: polysaccharide pyruvyl transferase CsaB [Fimbriimonadaceae bacterium]|nr:polysaccharide pyruvyl transferase CsaB [Fimbriimonadaceae bacterium]